MPNVIFFLIPLPEEGCKCKAVRHGTNMRMEDFMLKDDTGQTVSIGKVLWQQNGKTKHAIRIQTTVYEDHAEPKQGAGVAGYHIDAF